MFVETFRELGQLVLADFWSLQRSRLAGIPGANWLSSK